MKQSLILLSSVILGLLDIFVLVTLVYIDKIMLQKYLLEGQQQLIWVMLQLEIQHLQQHIGRDGQKALNAIWICK